MKYDPNAPITDEELDKMPDTELFEYLDSRAAYIRAHHTIKPLGQHQTKHYAAYSKGEALTDEELKRAKEIGRAGDDAVLDTIRDAMERLGGDPNKRDKGIKNIKTNRKQWFD